MNVSCLRLFWGRIYSVLHGREIFQILHGLSRSMSGASKSTQSLVLYFLKPSCLCVWGWELEVPVHIPSLARPAWYKKTSSHCPRLTAAMNFIAANCFMALAVIWSACSLNPKLRYNLTPRHFIELILSVVALQKLTAGKSLLARRNKSWLHL